MKTCVCTIYKSFVCSLPLEHPYQVHVHVEPKALVLDLLYFNIQWESAKSKFKTNELSSCIKDGLYVHLFGLVSQDMCSLQLYG